MMNERDCWSAYWQKCWKLCLRATLGPWEKVYTPKDGDWIANEVCGIISPYIDNTGAARIAVEETDLEFIAEARTALPAWLQRVKELEADNARLRAVAEAAKRLRAMHIFDAKTNVHKLEESIAHIDAEEELFAAVDALEEADRGE